MRLHTPVRRLVVFGLDTISGLDLGSAIGAVRFGASGGRCTVCCFISSGSGLCYLDGRIVRVPRAALAR